MSGLGLVVGGLVLCAPSLVKAEVTAPGGARATVVTKDVTGRISAITRDFINVVYQSDKDKGVDYEMLLSLGKDVELRYKRNLTDLKYGDTVRVTYEEAQEEAERPTQDGTIEPYMKILSRNVKTVTFLSPVKTGLVSGE